jgi:hypothetical protein
MRPAHYQASLKENTRISWVNLGMTPGNDPPILLAGGRGYSGFHRATTPDTQAEPGEIP